jgi:hypothetical protein
MKNILFAMLSFFVIGNILNADVINTLSFNNDSIGKEYIQTKAPINFDFYEKIKSNDERFMAINEYCYRIIIIDENNKVVFRFEWDDEITNFQKSDTVYILGWSNDSNYLWFLTYIPAEINYIAKVDIENKQLFIYDTKITDSVSHFVFDSVDEFLYYDNYFPNNYMNQYIDHSIYKYNIEAKEEKIIYKRNGGRNFNLRIEDGVIKYNE